MNDLIKDWLYLFLSTNRMIITTINYVTTCNYGLTGEILHNHKIISAYYY